MMFTNNLLCSVFLAAALADPNIPLSAPTPTPTSTTTTKPTKDGDDCVQITHHEDAKYVGRYKFEKTSLPAFRKEDEPTITIQFEKLVEWHGETGCFWNLGKEGGYEGGYYDLGECSSESDETPLSKLLPIGEKSWTTKERKDKSVTVILSECPVCTCENGRAAEGAACSADGPSCTECDDGFSFDKYFSFDRDHQKCYPEPICAGAFEESTDVIAVACTCTQGGGLCGSGGICSRGVCTPEPVCTCENGRAAEGAACSADQRVQRVQRVGVQARVPLCTECDDGFTLDRFGVDTNQKCYPSTYYKIEQDCVPYSKDACKAAALREGLQPGNEKWDFESQGYHNLGCFTYKASSLKEYAFYGSDDMGGPLEDKSSELEDRMDIVPGYDCAEPGCGQDACKAAALLADPPLELGYGNVAFASTASSYYKGCYTYRSGKYFGKAFYGISSTKALGGKVKVVPGYDCTDLKGTDFDFGETEWVTGWCMGGSYGDGTQVYLNNKFASEGKCAEKCRSLFRRGITVTACQYDGRKGNCSYYTVPITSSSGDWPYRCAINLVEKGLMHKTVFLSDDKDLVQKSISEAHESSKLSKWDDDILGMLGESFEVVGESSGLIDLAGVWFPSRVVHTEALVQEGGECHWRKDCISKHYCNPWTEKCTPYKLGDVNTNVCTDGIMDITNLSACKTAARGLGLTWANAVADPGYSGKNLGRSDRPKNCYMGPDSEAYWNWNSTGSEYALSTPICIADGVTPQ